MAVKLPEYTWQTQILTLKGFKTVVLSTVTGDVVGEIKDGKFVQTADSIPKPTVKTKKTVTVSKEAIAGGKQSALATSEMDANYYKSVAEDINKTDTERAKARQEYNKLQSEIAKLKLEAETVGKEISTEQKAKAEADAKTKARDEFNKLRTQYQTLEKQYNALLSPGTDPKGPEYQKQMYDIVNKSLSLYKTFSGSPSSVGEITSLLSGKKSAGPTSGGTLTGPTGLQGATGPKGSAGLTGVIGATGDTGGTNKPTGTGAAGGAGGTGAKGTGGVGGTGTTEPTGPVDKRTPAERYADAIAKAQELYNMPDIIFKNIASLGDLLKKYVNKELTDQQFAREIQNDSWYRTNSDEIKKRYVQLFNYEDLVKSGRAQGTTNYEQEIDRITRQIQATARRVRGTEISDADAKLMAKDLYIFNLDKDEAVVAERLARFIKPTAGMIGGKPTLGYGGEALQNYQTLQGFAKANGFKLEDILPRDAMGKPMTAESTLQALATGKLDINRIAQDVRKLAAQGQPDYVRELLGQGYDLDQIYAPYRSRMASILELDPNAIDLNDNALRMAIGKDGDLNLYDYEKALRKDSRWQYTKGAREEVSSAALQVLRDFGFQG